MLYPLSYEGGGVMVAVGVARRNEVGVGPGYRWAGVRS